MKTKWNEPLYQATEVLEILKRNGYEAYFVGGCVRDFLLEREIKDIDIASAATPDQIKEIFDSVIPLGLQYGTVLVRYKNISYEITTFRGKNGQSKIEKNKILKIEDDLEHRDFTINAMAMNRYGEINDRFSGKDDLNQKIIRSVKNANTRFQEDPLRILRAIRFTSQLEFTIESTTLYEMKDLKHHLDLVSVERITSELALIFQGNDVQKAIDYINQLEIYKHIPVWKENPELLEKLPKQLTSFTSLAEVIALFYYLDHRITISTWINGWKCSKKTKRDAHTLSQSLIYYFKHSIDNWLVYLLPNEVQVSFTHLICILTNQSIHSKIVDQDGKLPIRHRSELNINGNDLKELFYDRPHGRWIKDAMEAIEYQVVMGKIKNKKIVIKEWILCHPPAIN